MDDLFDGDAARAGVVDGLDANMPNVNTTAGVGGLLVSCPRDILPP